MSNIHNLKLREETVQLKFDNWAIYNLEKELGGKSPFIFLKEGGDVTSISFLASCVWAGLLHKDPDLTVRQAIEMFDLKFARMGDIANVLVQGLQDAYGIEDEKKKKVKEKQEKKKGE